ncbi:sensor histidine kinase [Actinocorallia sp. A-T 12471]|uniref:sensor histidine kinase n=1 Tax=Actinocorallia sp. A-T 12471 TaxID=3089813 RepID=UPI0029D21755|nr:histidine kinase [Actinocorallia sp. A-T 12471]MDX6740653.1 histidine kinase [Actinocorallia sp. A-T 12471]
MTSQYGEGRTEETQRDLRRLNRGIVSGSIAAVGALLAASEADDWREGLLLGGSLVVTLLVVNRWNAGRYSRLDLVGLLVTGAAWVVGVLAASTPTTTYGFAIMATIAYFELKGHRKALVAGIAAFTGAVIAVRLMVSDESAIEVLVRYVVVSLCVAVGGVVLMVLAYAIHDLVGELEKAREREAEVAVMRERVRFAGDLHDIQGHTLHVVKLKVVLARRLLRADVARAEAELDEVNALVGATIAQTRDLAHAQRRLNLSAELENAKNLFEAAGIRVEVTREGEVAPRASEPLGQVLRETTTNILRHADATHVWITLTETGISVTNDGVRTDHTPALSGLATLRDRLTPQGGTLTTTQQNGVFSTTATFPH